GTAVEHAGRGTVLAEVRGDEPAHVQGLGEQGVDDRELVVGLVLRVRVEDDAAGAGRGRGLRGGGGHRVLQETLARSSGAWASGTCTRRGRGERFANSRVVPSPSAHTSPSSDRPVTSVLSPRLSPVDGVGSCS